MSKQSYRTALITGAGGLTGQALVRRFVAMGMTVYAAGRDGGALDRLAEETGCIPVISDLADVGSFAAVFGPLEIDVLINNAGAGRAGSMFADASIGIDEQVDVNLRAIMHLTKLLAPRMLERDSGHIVLVGSMAGRHNFAGNAAYHATKAGAHMFARQLRLDFAGKRVRVSEISPGRIRTDMFAKALGIDAEEAGKRFFDGYEPLLPDDIADAAQFVVEAPARVNVSLMEIMPTMQVLGGMQMYPSTMNSGE